MTLRKNILSLMSCTNKSNFSMPILKWVAPEACDDYTYIKLKYSNDEYTDLWVVSMKYLEEESWICDNTARYKNGVRIYQPKFGNQNWEEESSSEPAQTPWCIDINTGNIYRKEWVWSDLNNKWFHWARFVLVSSGTGSIVPTSKEFVYVDDETWPTAGRSNDIQSGYLYKDELYIYPVVECYYDGSNFYEPDKTTPITLVDYTYYYDTTNDVWYLGFNVVTPIKAENRMSAYSSFSNGYKYNGRYKYQIPEEYRYDTFIYPIVLCRKSGNDLYDLDYNLITPEFSTYYYPIDTGAANEGKWYEWNGTEYVEVLPITLNEIHPTAMGVIGYVQRNDSFDRIFYTPLEQPEYYKGLPLRYALNIASANSITVNKISGSGKLVVILKSEESGTITATWKKFNGIGNATDFSSITYVSPNPSTTASVTRGTGLQAIELSCDGLVYTDIVLTTNFTAEIYGIIWKPDRYLWDWTKKEFGKAVYIPQMNTQTEVGELYGKRIYYKTTSSKDRIQTTNNSSSGTYRTIFLIWGNRSEGISTISTDAISCNGGKLNIYAQVYTSGPGTLSVNAVKGDTKRNLNTQPYGDVTAKKEISINLTEPLDDEQIEISFSGGQYYLYWVEFIPDKSVTE